MFALVFELYSFVLYSRKLDYGQTRQFQLNCVYFFCFWLNGNTSHVISIKFLFYEGFVSVAVIVIVCAFCNFLYKMFVFVSNVYASTCFVFLCCHRFPLYYFVYVSLLYRVLLSCVCCNCYRLFFSLHFLLFCNVKLLLFNTFSSIFYIYFFFYKFFALYFGVTILNSVYLLFVNVYVCKSAYIHVSVSMRVNILAFALVESKCQRHLEF